MPSNIPDAPADIATEVADLLQAVAHRMRREARDGRGAFDVTWAQARALRTLSRLAEPVRMSVLADELHIARRSATSVVDELESRGLVARGNDPADRRGVTVHVTAAGRKVLAAARDRRRDATIDMLAALSAAELRSLRDLLARVVR